MGREAHIFRVAVGVWLVCTLALADISFNGRVVPSDGMAADRLELRRRARTAIPFTAVVGLARNPTPAEEVAFDAAGVELRLRLPDGGWVARVRPDPVPLPPTLRDLVQAFAPLTPATRLADGVFAPSGGDEAMLHVHLLPGASTTHALSAWPANQGSVRVEDGGLHPYLAVRVAEMDRAAVLAAFAAEPDVIRIEPAWGARLFDDRTARILQSGREAGNNPLFTAGIYGSNQVIAVCDTGIDADSCYFRDPVLPLPPANTNGAMALDPAQRKVIAVHFLHAADDPANARHWDDVSGHGTLVAGHALGALLDDPLGVTHNNGMAPLAKLVAQDAGSGTDDCSDLPALGCPVSGFLAVLEQAYSQGARIHNNSWGDNENGTLGPRNRYSQTAREIDWMTWSNRDFLVVCAAGNDGPGPDTVSSPSTAKNALSVGACGNGNPAFGLTEEQLADFSARGWASDGRVKPDVIAPGYLPAAASGDGRVNTSNCTIVARAGTSFAAPNVAGLAALVRDYFAQGFYPGGFPNLAQARPNVSAALVKAVLINAAQDMQSAPTRLPSRDQGWGRVNLSRTLELGKGGRRLFVADATHAFAADAREPWRVYLYVYATNQPLQVTLCWTDPPAAPGAERHLVNDLDLTVTSFEHSFLGNHFQAGLSAEGGRADRTNNVEQVLWYPSTTGVVELVVAPASVGEGPQDFALVASGSIVEWSATRDADGDGLPDVWEWLHFGTLATLPDGDTDGDGMSHAEEWVAGTDPLDQRSVFRVESADAAAGGLVLRWSSSGGRVYALHGSTNVADTIYTAIASNLPAMPPLNTATVQPTGVHSVYRVSVDWAAEP